MLQEACRYSAATILNIFCLKKYKKGSTCCRLFRLIFSKTRVTGWGRPKASAFLLLRFRGSIRWNNMLAFAVPQGWQLMTACEINRIVLLSNRHVFVFRHISWQFLVKLNFCFFRFFSVCLSSNQSCNSFVSSFVFEKKNYMLRVFLSLSSRSYWKSQISSSARKAHVLFPKFRLARNHEFREAYFLSLPISRLEPSPEAIDYLRLSKT